MTTTPEIKPYLDHAETVRTRYRRALLCIGKSMDYHIYDLSNQYLSSLRKSDAVRFLLRIKRFYDSLDLSDQMIFVNEVLERDRHYRFWFMGQEFRKGEFEARKSGLLRRIPRSIP